MNKILLTIRSYIEKFFSWFSLLLLLSMLLITVTQIIFRNFFGIHLNVASEIARQEVIWLTFTGGILSTLKGKHIAIDLLSKIIPLNFKNILATILNISAAIVCIIMVYFSINFVKMEIEFSSMIADKIPAWTFQIIIPIGFLFMSISFLLNIIDDNVVTQELTLEIAENKEEKDI